MAKWHHKRNTNAYRRWRAMMQRCSNPRADNYKYYGGKGIRVCDRWRDFEAFLEDMGECQDGMTLDRIDNAKGYLPGNCRWVSQAEQNRNRSLCIHLTHDGVTKSLPEWAADIGMTPNALRQRILLGWTVERALTQALKPRGVKK